MTRAHAVCSAREEKGTLKDEREEGRVEVNLPLPTPIHIYFSTDQELRYVSNEGQYYLSLAARMHMYILDQWVSLFSLICKTPPATEAERDG